MADKFDPYREALVMETGTRWPADYADIPVAERVRVEQALHSKPAECSQIEYVRTHTGFCRTITVTPADFQRVGS